MMCCVGVNVANLVEVSCLLEVLSSSFCGAAVVVFVGTVVPAFNLNQVPPVQACPCRTSFCWCCERFRNCSSKSSLFLSGLLTIVLL